MNKQLVDKWVAALRSGEYKQGHGRLNKNGNFCCLGVLCDVAGIPKTQSSRGVCSYGQSSESLDVNVRAVVGVDSMLGEPKHGYRVDVSGRSYASLADANDNNVSFADLADWIEQNWEKL